MTARKILVMGLPGSGKTTLAKALCARIGAVHFDADAVRATISADLGFSLTDRIEQAKRMGWLCDQVVQAGHHAVASFVCPTNETRAAFGDAYTVFVNTHRPTLYADTKAIFVPPERVDYYVAEQDAEGHARAVSDILLCGTAFDWRKPTALFVGRYQPFHEGHRALVSEGIKRVGQACVAVRATGGIDESNPFEFTQIRERIRKMMPGTEAVLEVISVPNVSAIYYGRKVGYSIERIDLAAELQQISATSIRAEMGY